MGSFDPAYTGKRSGNYRESYGLGAFGFPSLAALQSEAGKFQTSPAEYLQSQARVREGILLSPEDSATLLRGMPVAGFDTTSVLDAGGSTGVPLDQTIVTDDGGGTGGTTFTTDPSALPSDWQSALWKNPLWDLTKYGSRPYFALGKMASSFGPDVAGDPIAQGLINALVLPGLREDISVGDITPGLGGIGRDELYDWFKYDFLPYMSGDDLYSAGGYDPKGEGIGAGKLLMTPEETMAFGMSQFDELPLSLQPDLTADILNKLNLSIGAEDIDFDAPGVGANLLAKLGIMPVGVSAGGGPGFSLAPGVGRELAKALDLQIGEDFTISPETAGIITDALQAIIPSSEDLFSDIIENVPGADILVPLTDKITDVGTDLTGLGEQAEDINFSNAFQALLGPGEGGVGATLTDIEDRLNLFNDWTMPSGISEMDDVVTSLYSSLFGDDGRGGLRNWQPGAGLLSLKPGGDIGLGASTVSDLLDKIGGFDPQPISGGLKTLDTGAGDLLEKLSKAKGSFAGQGGLDALMQTGGVRAEALRKTLEDASGIKIDLPSLGDLPDQIGQLSADIPGVEQQLRSLIAAGKVDEGIINAISNLMSGQMPTASDISTIVNAVNQGLQLPDEAMGRLGAAITAAEGRVGDLQVPDLEQVTSDQILGALDMPGADQIMTAFPGLTDAMTKLQDDITNLKPSIDTGAVDLQIRDIADRISNLQPSIDTGAVDMQVLDIANRISDLDLPTQAQLLGAMDLPTQAQLLSAMDMPDQVQLLGAMDLPTQAQLLTSLDMPDQVQLLGAMDMPDQTALLGALDLPTQQALLSSMTMPGADMLLGALDMPGQGALLGALDMPSSDAMLGALDMPGQTQLLDRIAESMNLTSGEFLNAFPGIGDALSGLAGQITGPDGLGDSLTGLTALIDAMQPGVDLNLDKFFTAENMPNLFPDLFPGMEDLMGDVGSLTDFLSPMMEGDANFWPNLQAQLSGQLSADDLAGLETEITRLGKLVADFGGGGGGDGGDGAEDGAVAGTGADLVGSGGWLGELQDQIRAGFGRDPSEFGTLEKVIDPDTGEEVWKRTGDQTYAEYLREDPITASLLADYLADADAAELQLREDMNRMGLLGGGGNTGTTDMGNVFGDFLAASKRGESALVSDAAKRAQDLRVKALDQGSTLSDIMSRRDIGIGELMGYLGDERTLGGREADMDVLAAAMGALDPDLKLGTEDLSDANRQLFEIITTQLDLPPETIESLAQIIYPGSDEEAVRKRETWQRRVNPRNRKTPDLTPKEDG